MKHSRFATDWTKLRCDTRVAMLRNRRFCGAYRGCSKIIHGKNFAKNIWLFLMFRLVFQALDPGVTALSSVGLLAGPTRSPKILVNEANGRRVDGIQGCAQPLRPDRSDHDSVRVRCRNCCRSSPSKGLVVPPDHHHPERHRSHPSTAQTSHRGQRREAGLTPF